MGVNPTSHAFMSFKNILFVRNNRIIFFLYRLNYRGHFSVSAEKNFPLNISPYGGGGVNQ